MQARPTGITILAILAAVGGALVLLGGLAALGLGGFALSVGGPMVKAIGVLVTLSGVLALAVGLLDLALAYGAWTLQPWAWTLGVIVEVLAIVRSGVFVLGVHHKVATFAGELVPLAIALLILYYLFTPRVRAAFGR